MSRLPCLVAKLIQMFSAHSLFSLAPSCLLSIINLKLINDRGFAMSSALKLQSQDCYFARLIEHLFFFASLRDILPVLLKHFFALGILHNSLKVFSLESI